MELNRDPQAWTRLGQALRESRERLSLSQGELAARAGVSTGAVQRVEAGTVPKTRMPLTLAPIAKALGWPAGYVDAVLGGAEPPGGWRNVSVTLDDSQVGMIITNALVRALSNTPSVEIRNAVKIAVDDLRRHGVSSETNDVQPNELNEST